MRSGDSHIPPGWPSVIPRLFVDDPGGLVRFIKEVLGADGEFNENRPSELRIGDCLVMVGGTLERASSSAFLYVYVPDVDLAYRKALGLGAVSIEAPAEMPYGDRRAMIRDPWGNHWQVARHQNQGRVNTRAPDTRFNELSIRSAQPADIPEIEAMVSDFVKGHPADGHNRPTETLRDAYFGNSPVAHLLVAERTEHIVGMIQWTLIYDMFWGMYGAETGWLYVKPRFRRSGIVAALVARACADSSKVGAEFLHGGGGDGPSKLYERVAIGNAGRDCYLSGKAYQEFAKLDGLPVREIVRRIPDKRLGLQPAD